MKTFIVAIPVFDKEMSVLAYRLCDKNATKLFGTAHDYQAAGEYLLSPGLNYVDKIGIEPFSGGKPLIVNLNQYLLLMGMPANTKIPPELLICMLPKDITQDELILQKCQTLLDMGYRLGLDGFPLHSPKSPLMGMVQYVMLDYTQKNYSTQLRALMPHMHSKTTIVQNVPDTDSFLKVSNTPNGLFSGNFYSQPITKDAESISPLKLNALRLLNEVSQDDFDIGDIAKVIERDVSISIALLRFINSPAVGVRQRISSIRNAVAILGQREIKQWVNVAVSVTIAEDRPGEITKLSLVRAKFAENLANAYSLGVFAPSLFMAGLFSLLDVILQNPMEIAIKEISVDERVHKALVEHSGPLYEVLDLIYAYERADWDKVSINMLRNNIDANTISQAFVDALIWYKELLTEIDKEL